MATMNGSDECAKKSAESRGEPTQQTTKPGNDKGLTYESPLPQVLAGTDSVYAEIRRALVDAKSQRFASTTLWLLNRLADLVEVMSADPQHAPHPAQLDKNEERAERKAARKPLQRTRRRSRQTAPENPEIIHHIGGIQLHEHTWSPTPSITEVSDHADLLRGIDNLHSYMRANAANNPERAKLVVRELARAVAMTLGAASARRTGEGGNVLQASPESVRNWDILKVPRTPAPGLRFDGVRGAPLFDVHAVLDTGMLHASLMAIHLADGTLQQRIEWLKQNTNGDEALYKKIMEAYAFTSIPGTPNTNPDGSVKLYSYEPKPPSAVPQPSDKAGEKNGLNERPLTGTASTDDP